MTPQTQEMIGQAIQAFQTGDLVSAETILTKVLQAHKNNLPAIHIMGLIHASNGKHTEAAKFLKKALALNPNEPSLLYNLGKALSESGYDSEAIAHYRKALNSIPNNPEIWLGLGKSLSALAQLEEALGAFKRALELKPSYIEALINSAIAYRTLKQHDQALASLHQAIQVAPNFPDAWLGLGNTYVSLKMHEDAILAFNKAIELNPDYAEAWSKKAAALNQLKKHDLAIEAHQRAMAIKPLSFELGRLIHQKMLICDWDGFKELSASVKIAVQNKEKVADPFGYQGISESEEDLKLCAEIFGNEFFKPQHSSKLGTKKHHGKIKVGYVCGEFREQATSILMTGIYEHHDKSQFEIYAFDNGFNDGSVIRKRIENAFDQVVDISHLTDEQAVAAIKTLDIDILVNLNGYFGEARQSIFAQRAAPIQVNYLGFPGTLGVDYMDYLIADQISIPESSRSYYSEKICYLPNSYQANDSKREISNKEFSRMELGLPEKGFVFCCFNNNYKITPDIFDSWIKILKNVEGSVLWLLEDSALAKINLIKEASTRGVDSTRLIFAKRVSPPEHLSRHHQADLFLDTLPYNAHTTASDALWTGLPVLTLAGNTFPGRVGSSLLTAIDLPELITRTSDEYEALAIELAKNPDKLKTLTAKLIKNRSNTALFNTALFTKNLEEAYKEMFRRHQNNLPLDHINLDQIEN